MAASNTEKVVCPECGGSGSGGSIPGSDLILKCTMCDGKQFIHAVKWEFR